MNKSVDRPADRIYIAGAGRMGQGIALSFIFAGIPVVLIDLKDRPDDERRSYFEQITENIGKELRAMAALDLIDADEIATTLARVTCSDRAGVEAELIDSTLVFEGVPEVMEVKKEAFAWLDKFISAETIVASTTSTFLVTDLADFVSHPGRFINAHWLNPAHLMPLVEVSCGDATDENVRESLVEILKRVGKVPVVCSASAG
jgi:3-hydroxybutyryl-CoA dehydrogenase